MFDFNNFSEDILRNIFSFLDFAKADNRLDNGKEIKYVNKRFHKLYHDIHNVKCFNLVKQIFGFEPPLNKAPLIGKICTFIASNGKQVFSNYNTEDLSRSADEILHQYLDAPWAYYYLSLLHLNIVKPANEKLATEYCMKAVGFDFPPAIYLFATFFRKGSYDFGQNQEMMLKYLKMADAKNYLEAKVDLGIFYFDHGEQEKGIDHLEKAANKNNTRALNVLGQIYIHGLQDITSNAEKAIQYLDTAIDLGSSEAAKTLADSFLFGKGCIVQDSEKYKAYLIKHYEIEINNKNAAAARKLGILYRQDKNEKQATKYMELAVSLNDGVTLFQLASHYRGKGNITKAIEYYKKALPLLINGAEKGSYDERSALDGAKLDGAWLITQGEFRLGKDYIANSTRFGLETPSFRPQFIPLL